MSKDDVPEIETSDLRAGQCASNAPDECGELIQRYVRARWQSGQLDGSLRTLEERLRARVDDLGFDAERLLGVASSAVLARLEQLEHEAVVEDNRVAPIVRRLRMQEEATFERSVHGHSTQNPGPHGSGVQLRQHRIAGRPGRSRQRR